MPRNFSLPALSKLRALPLARPLGTPFAPMLTALKDTQVRVRIVLGLLLVANLVAATFAFHLFDDSPEQLARQVQSARQQVVSQLVKLNHTRMVAGKIDKGREEGARFIDTNMTSRRTTYSTILGEIDGIAAQNGMKSKDAVIGLEAIQGTELDQMTITANFEGEYKNLLLFINAIDQSKRFLIIQSLTAVPQLVTKLQVTLKLITFVKEDSTAS
jgi:hypothetical protein